MSLPYSHGADARAPASPEARASATSDASVVPPFSGVITAIATPFTTNGELDLVAFRALLAHLKAAGTHGVVVAGTTGESPTLSDEEKETLVREALSVRDARFRVYVGTGGNATRETVAESVKYARFRNGTSSVDGVMAVVPYYNKPTQTGQYEHFSAVAKAIGDVPLCLYNVPGRTGATLAVHTSGALFEAHGNVVAIKEAAGNVGVITELARALEHSRSKGDGREIQILSGDDPTFAPALLCGATGVISVTSHVIPKAMVRMFRAAREGDLATLSALHRASYPVNADLFCAPNPIPLKWALARLGLCENVLRLPLTPLGEQEQAVVAAALEAARAAGLELATPPT